MTNYYFNIPKTPQNRITLPCLWLCIIIIVVLGFIPIAPNLLVKVLKPLFLFLCLFVGKSGYYRYNYERWLVVLIFYLGIIWITHLGSNQGTNSYFSMVLFAFFFLVAGLRIWSASEIRLLMTITMLASTFCAVVVLLENGFAINNGGNQHITFLAVSINRNTIAFGIVPGFFCASIFSFYTNKHFIIRLGCIISSLVCLYAVVALSCRSSFLAALLGLILILWQVTSENASYEVKFSRRLAVVIVLVLLLFAAMSVLAGTNSERLFDYSSSGRDGLWEKAIELIRLKPIFGGGYDYWADNSNEFLSPHNTFLSIMLISGFFGGAILGSMFLIMIWNGIKLKNYIPLAFVSETVLHSISESGLDYYAYIPMMFFSVLFHFMESYRVGMYELMIIGDYHVKK